MPRLAFQVAAQTLHIAEPILSTRRETLRKIRSDHGHLCLRLKIGSIRKPLVSQRAVSRPVTRGLPSTPALGNPSNILRDPTRPAFPGETSNKLDEQLMSTPKTLNSSLFVLYVEEVGRHAIENWTKFTAPPKPTSSSIILSLPPQILLIFSSFPFLFLILSPFL